MASAIRSAASNTSSCSQIRMTRQPEARSASSLRASRTVFADSFSRHQARFAAGSVPWSGHECQKHPSTNTATRRRVNTMSGRHASLGGEGNNRFESGDPRRWSSLRSASSGPVSRRLLAIIVARAAAEDAGGGGGAVDHHHVKDARSDGTSVARSKLPPMTSRRPTTSNRRAAPARDRAAPSAACRRAGSRRSRCRSSLGGGRPKPRAIDLFCGAGGLSLGLRDAGFSVLVGADANAWAVETHTANLGGLGYVGDLSEPDELLEQLRRLGDRPCRARRRRRAVPAVLQGGPGQVARADPCRRAPPSRIRGHLLWRSFMQVVERLNPDAVLVENVPDLPSWDDGAVLSGFLAEPRRPRLLG